jgi:heavy metal sensor kinase
MNARSLKFQLLVWYAGLLTACFLVLGAAAYFALRSYLSSDLKHTQLRRARQIAQLVTEQKQDAARISAEIENRYAPGQNDRFVRIAHEAGQIVYTSSNPASGSFAPSNLPTAAWPKREEGTRRIELPNGHRLLVTSHILEAAGGKKYLIETGALMDDLEQDLHQWLTFLLGGLPVVVVMAVGGGYLLVNRALRPVDEIVASAERIGSQNLEERLPLPHTGDELERLSVALNRMLERLDQAFQYSRRFVADASHELRTPLTVLRGELEGFAEDERLTAELRERVGSALEEVERLVNIVEGLFAISRLDAGEAQAEWVKFDLGKLATATADQMSLLAEDKEIKVSCAAPPGVMVEGDRARMKQVIVNLLDNAIKYTPAGGAVGMTVGARENKAVLEVADNGIGIPRDALPRVFDRFYRVNKARSRAEGGAGLGLSIVKSICTAHHGNVEGSSAPGRGSVFRVELPLVTNHASKNNGKHFA